MQYNTVRLKLRDLFMRKIELMKKLTRKETADYLLHDCGLLAELTKYGKVHPIGSYRMDMMAWNDLDLDVKMTTCPWKNCIA